MVIVVDDDVKTRESLNFVQLITAFVDIAVTRHEDANLGASLLDELRQSPAHCSNF